MSSKQFTVGLERLGHCRQGADPSQVSVPRSLCHQRVTLIHNKQQLLSLRVQSFFWSCLFLCVPFSPCSVAGHNLTPLDKRRLWRGSHCSAAGGSSSGSLPAGSGGMSSCTSSVLIATLSGCSQRFSCSSVLRRAKTPRETSEQQSRTRTYENSARKTLRVYFLHLRGS